ncbi:unnamed protein product, partial [Acidocella sp. C78]
VTLLGLRQSLRSGSLGAGRSGWRWDDDAAHRPCSGRVGAPVNF